MAVRRNGWVIPHSPSVNEIRDLLRMAVRCLVAQRVAKRDLIPHELSK